MELFKEDKDIKNINEQKLKESVPKVKSLLKDVAQALNSASEDYLLRNRGKNSESFIRQNISRSSWCSQFAEVLNHVADKGTLYETDNDFRASELSRFKILLREMIKDKLPIAETMASLYNFARSAFKDYYKLVDSYSRSW